MNRTTLVIATSNPGKILEFEKILGSTNFDFLSLKDIGFSGTIEENGSTFAQNAEIKARAVADFLASKGLAYPVLADDSGLEVVALHGEPGIFTARYAGLGASDKDNYEKLLENLAGNPDRRARFVCWLCWIVPGHSNETKHFQGHCSGRILLSPRGTQGFGYDPIFEPEGFHKSFGEMSHEEKKRLSHRGEAIKHLQAWLNHG